MATPRPMDVGILNPLHIPVSAEVMRAIVEDSIAAILQNRPPLEAPDDAFETELMLTQRREFLDWLRLQGRDVAMAMYPLDDEPMSFEGVLLS